MSSSVTGGPASESVEGVPLPEAMLVTPVFPPARGGIETLALGLVEHCRNVSWSVCTLEEPGSGDWDAAQPFEVARASNVPRGGRRSMFRLNALVALQALRGPRPALVVNMHVRSAPGAWVAAKLARGRLVQYYHAKELATWPRATRFAASVSDVDVCVSSYTEQLLQRVAGRPATAILPPGVDVSAVPQRPRTHAREPWLLSVSRLDDEYKGHDVVLRALPAVLRQRPNARWVVVGDGRLRPRLEAQARELGVDAAVEFRGRVDDVTRDDLYARCTAFVLPSRASADGRAGEGFGIVYAEAAARGLPSIAAHEGGAVDAVHHEATGLLVDPRDPQAVAAAALRLLGDPALVQRMGEAGREHARAFAWSSVASRFESLLSAP